VNPWLPQTSNVLALTYLTIGKLNTGRTYESKAGKLLLKPWDQ